MGARNPRTVPSCEGPVFLQTMGRSQEGGGGPRTERPDVRRDAGPYGRAGGSESPPASLDRRGHELGGSTSTGLNPNPRSTSWEMAGLHPLFTPFLWISEPTLLYLPLNEEGRP